LSWHVHFFKDYCLGGNEYINIADYYVRHLPKLDKQDLKNKTFYPKIFKAAARMSDSDSRDYSFLEESLEL
jgi:hypothetical protein